MPLDFTSLLKQTSKLKEPSTGELGDVSSFTSQDGSTPQKRVRFVKAHSSALSVSVDPAENDVFVEDNANHQVQNFVEIVSKILLTLL